jgi:hypothetical protein
MKDTGTIKVIDLLSKPSKQITNLSEIASDVQYIPLQTSENSLIRYINDFKTGNNKFYVYTITEILCFDDKGNFLYKLNKTGRGPEEYTYIYDYDISPENNLLLILIPKKVVIYNETEDGFVYSKVLSFRNQPSYADFIPGQKSILLSYRTSPGNEPFQNVLINLDGDTLSSRSNYYTYKKTNNTMFAMNFDNVLFKNDNMLHFKGMLSDTVFTINQNNQIKPYWILNSSGKQLTTSALANFSVGEMAEYIMAEYINLAKILEVKRYLIYKYSYNKNVHFEVYDKVLRKKFEITDKIFLVDDIAGGTNFEPRFSSEGKLYSWVDAVVLKKYVSGEDFQKSAVKDPEKKAAMKKMADSLNETDNQVMIVVTPKN